MKKIYSSFFVIDEICNVTVICYRYSYLLPLQLFVTITVFSVIGVTYNNVNFSAFYQ